MKTTIKQLRKRQERLQKQIAVLNEKLEETEFQINRQGVKFMDIVYAHHD